MSEDRHRRNQWILVASVVPLVAIAWILTSASWSPWSHPAPPSPSAAASAAPSSWRCTADSCDAQSVTPELARRLADMPGPRRTLRLEGVTNETLATLRMVPSLLELAISGTGQPLDLSPLGDLHVLRELVVNDATVKSFAPLRSTHVQSLTLTNVKGLPDLSFVASLAALEELTLDGNGLPSITTLAGSHLRRLVVRTFDPLSLEGVAAIGGLQQLALDKAPIADLSPLAGLDRVEELELGWTHLPAVVPLPPHLKTLALLSDGITDVSFLRAETSLTLLSLLANDVENLSPLKSLTLLKELNLDGNPRLQDLAPLAALKNLQTLSISRTQVKNLQPLVGLPLKTLYVGQIFPESILPLAQIPTLESVQMLPKNYPAAEVDQLRKTKPHLRISRN